MIVKTSLIFASAAIIKGLISFIVIAVYTRLLSPDAFGDYAILIVIINVGDMFAFMWLRQALMRHIDDTKKADDHTVLSNITYLYLCVGVGIALLGMLPIMLDLLPIFQIAGAVIIAEALVNLMIMIARMRLTMLIFFILSIAKPLIALMLGALLIVSGLDVFGAALGLLAACAIAAVIGLLRLPDFKTLKASAVSRAQIYAIAGFGLPLIVMFSMQSAIKVTDRLLLEVMIGGDLTGLYAAAQDIPYKLIMIITSALHLALYPLAMKALDSHGKVQCDQQLAINFTALMAILTPASLGIIILSQPMASVFLGENFRGFAGVYIPIFAAITALSCMTQYYFILAFHLAKRNDLTIIPGIAALMINAGLGVWLIPSIGALGAAGASAMAYFTVLIASMRLGHKVFPMPVPVDALIKILTASSVMAVALWLISVPNTIAGLAIGVAFGGILYCGMLWVLNPMNMRGYCLKVLKS